MRIFEKDFSEQWTNPVPLAKGPYVMPSELLENISYREALPLDTFPVIEDFEVVLLPKSRLLEDSWRKEWGYYLGFFSQQRGLLASFGLWGHAVIDYSQDFTPLDFWDLEQGWDQVIFERGEYVYVLEGDIDDYIDGYHCWFRVRKERYIEEWEAALKVARQIIKQKDET
ncbi:hypothetical protein KSC_011380 [Ktedonobacter sp. SOSP1-52]|uniref:hypothetical protein n=1 Tax=Ktedonobacter sp. SOSP1-52 TaxID=2778366 RepID=UPI00191573F3|nr:hypothetical protein [Ktedonobacter sp. SOSP1-52]GHO62246.1 hypothetical protein KSC_011380 [Ktedonobacter sp. SOSP1-52]